MSSSKNQATPTPAPVPVPRLSVPMPTSSSVQMPTSSVPTTNDSMLKDILFKINEILNLLDQNKKSNQTILTGKTVPVIGGTGFNVSSLQNLFGDLNTAINNYIISLQKPGKRTDKIHIQLYKSLLNRANYLENLMVKHFRSSGSFFGEIVDSINGIDNMIELIKTNGKIPEGNYSKLYDIERQPIYKEGNVDKEGSISQKTITQGKIEGGKNSGKSQKRKKRKHRKTRRHY
jgi:hypothetical protein